jgi:hypothetical protein
VRCFFPSLNVAIEVDGFYWHKKQTRKDRAKNKQLNKKKIEVIRVRQPGLPKIGRHDVLQQTNETELNICQRTVTAILDAHLIHRKDLRDVQHYLVSAKLHNESLFLKLNNILPDPLPGTSLAELKPAIAKEWHPSRNEILTPADVSLHSNRRCWWKCAKGEDHEWQTPINDRSSGRGCPFCAGRRVSQANSLIAVNPQLATEWHAGKNKMLTPKDVTAFSHKRVGDRIRVKHCPICTRKELHLSNCLAKVRPDLAREWLFAKNGNLTPRNLVPGSALIVWWKCEKCYHEWRASLNNRSQGRGCPVCAYKKRWQTRKRLFGASGGCGPAPNRIRTKNLDTNVVYPSITEAAKQIGVSDGGLRRAMKRSKVIRGLHFAFA